MYLFSEVLDCPRDYLFRRKQRHHCQGFRVSGKTLNQIVSIQMRSTLFCDFSFVHKIILWTLFMIIWFAFCICILNPGGANRGGEGAEEEDSSVLTISSKKSQGIKKMIIILMIIKRYSSFTSLDNLIKEKSRFSSFTICPQLRVQSSKLLKGLWRSKRVFVQSNCSPPTSSTQHWLLTTSIGGSMQGKQMITVISGLYPTCSER